MECCLLTIVACLVFLYILTSVFFFLFPHLLHDVTKRTFPVWCVAHRGGAGESIECTLEAYKKSRNAGADVFEMDVLLTSDEQVVVCHDMNLKRVTGIDILIKDCSYKDLPPVKKELEVHFSEGTYYKHNGPPQSIPLLKDVFEVLKGAPILLEIKDNNDVLIDKTYKLIQEYNLEKKVIWGSFDVETNEKLRQKNPNIHMSFSQNSILWMYFYFFVGLLPFMKYKTRFLMFILPSIIPKHYTEQGQYLKYVPYIGLVTFLTMRRCLFQHLQKRGITVCLWTLNDEESFKQAYDLGVDGIITDDPQKLIAWTKENVAPKKDK